MFEPRDFLLPRLGLAVPRMAALFLSLGVLAFLVGQLFALLARGRDLRESEGFAIVGLAWILVAVAGALPLALSGVLPRPVDAFFESMSGITTTGYSVVPDLDLVPESVLFWRALLQWIGGGGIAILSVAVLSRLTESGVRLMRAEAPGVAATRLKPKIAQTAKTLYGVYIALTVGVSVALFILLYHGHELPLRWALFDSLTLSFATVATGGFSSHSAGLALYADWRVDVVVLVGMLLGGTSFTLLFFAVRDSPRRLLADPEFRFYLLVVLLGTLLVAANLVAAGPTWSAKDEAWAAFGPDDPTSAAGILAATRHAAFQVVSLLTTTGFSTADFDQWPESSRLVLFLLMFAGATTGSTTGALKLSRTLLLVKVAAREFQRLLNPRAILHVRLAGKVVREETLQGVMSFVFAYMALFLLSTAFLSVHGFDIFSAMATSAGSLGNVGQGFGLSGPTASLSGHTDTVKGWLTFLMWVGRLEIFAALVLLAPATWRR